MSSPGAGHCFMSIVSVHFASKEEGHWEDNQQYLILSALKECGVCWWLVWRFTLLRQTWPFAGLVKGSSRSGRPGQKPLLSWSKVWEGHELRGCECGCQRKKETQQGSSVTWEGREDSGCLNLDCVEAERPKGRYRWLGIFQWKIPTEPRIGAQESVQGQRTQVGVFLCAAMQWTWMWVLQEWEDGRCKDLSSVLRGNWCC